jgi:hypothetical protein
LEKSCMNPPRDADRVATVAAFSDPRPDLR